MNFKLYRYIGSFLKGFQHFWLQQAAEGARPHEDMSKHSETDSCMLRFFIR
jgi:hypothetical protein